MEFLSIHYKHAVSVAIKESFLLKDYLAIVLKLVHPTAGLEFMKEAEDLVNNAHQNFTRSYLLLVTNASARRDIKKKKINVFIFSKKKKINHNFQKSLNNVLSQIQSEINLVNALVNRVMN